MSGVFRCDRGKVAYFFHLTLRRKWGGSWLVDGLRPLEKLAPVAQDIGDEVEFVESEQFHELSGNRIVWSTREQYRPYRVEHEMTIGLSVWWIVNVRGVSGKVPSPHSRSKLAEGIGSLRASVAGGSRLTINIKNGVLWHNALLLVIINAVIV